MVHLVGIEPTSSVLESAALPLSYRSVVLILRVELRRAAYETAALPLSYTSKKHDTSIASYLVADHGCAPVLVDYETTEILNLPPAILKEHTWLDLIPTSAKGLPKC